MSLPLILTQPIIGEVDDDGRLIRADEPLRRLHIMAGGIEGGTLAIPGLAAIAALTLRIKMRLARAVYVADGDADIELWVETKMLGCVVQLSILGWRSLSPAEHSNVMDRQSDLGMAQGQFALQLDAELRVIGATGALPNSFDRASFGRSLEDICELSDVEHRKWRNAVLNQTGFHDQTIKFVGDDTPYSMIANPIISENGDFSGYTADFLPLSEVAVVVTSPPPAILFGQQLAPVLRQPLGRIIANAETIGSKLQGPIRENYAVYAKDIADAARHLVGLVDDLGDLEALERPDFSTAKDVIELGDVARRVAGLLSLKAADHHITVQLPDPEHTITAIAEFRRVLQIMLNLVTNAIRYSPDGTTVSIAISQADNMAEISVSDQGAGIEPTDHDKIFEKFERLGRTGDGGSGLGLYISRRLARFMGGDLTVGSSAEGGAKFTLRLPLGSDEY